MKKNLDVFSKSPFTGMKIFSLQQSSLVVRSKTATQTTLTQLYFIYFLTSEMSRMLGEDLGRPRTVSETWGRNGGASSLMGGIRGGRVVGYRPWLILGGIALSIDLFRLTLDPPPAEVRGPIPS